MCTSSVILTVVLMCNFRFLLSNSLPTDFKNGTVFRKKPELATRPPLAHLERNLAQLLSLDAHNRQGTAQLDFSSFPHYDDLLIFPKIDQTLFGNFTSYGTIRPISGHIVKLHPYRACERTSLGLDATLAGQVVVVMVEEIEPFLAGCVVPYNQALFARDSQAIGVIFDTQTLRRPEASFMEKIESLGIPVVAVSGLQAQSLQSFLRLTSQRGWQARVRVKIHRNMIVKKSIDNYFGSTTTSSWPGILPAALESGAFSILLLLVIMIFIIVLYKANARAKRKNEISLSLLAKEALNKMTVRKLRLNESAKNTNNSNDAKNMQKFHHRVSLVLKMSGDACSICLEEFKDGNVLRIITCGHGFHKSCVDPWLLRNHTCPLCMYDVVFKQYTGSPEILEQANLENLQQETAPLLREQHQTILMPTLHLENEHESSITVACDEPASKTPTSASYRLRRCKPDHLSQYTGQCGVRHFKQRPLQRADNHSDTLQFRTKRQKQGRADFSRCKVMLNETEGYMSDNSSLMTSSYIIEPKIVTMNNRRRKTVLFRSLSSDRQNSNHKTTVYESTVRMFTV